MCAHIEGRQDPDARAVDANEDLRALAARYGITIENVGAAGSGSRAAGSGGP